MASRLFSYGNDENRVDLLNRLYQAGYHIEFVNETCQRYAIINHSIVWYGSINLLSKVDIEDSIMRIISNDMSIELLEHTLGQVDKRQEWIGKLF